MTLPDLEAWGVFAKVAAAGSFATAAAELNLSNATVSKIVARLETRLGERLFHRNTRRITLTAAGEGLVARASRILSEAEDAEAQVASGSAAPKGVVRVSAPMSFGLTQIAPLLPSFFKRYPEITIDLHLDDSVVDVIAGGIDVAVRISSLADSSLMMRKLCPVRRTVVGAVSYFKKYGEPRRPRDLADHACLLYSNLATGDVWHLTASGRRREAVKVSGPLIANNGDALQAALEGGLGLALQPDFIAWEGLKSGKLVRCLPEWEAPLVHVNLVTPPGGPRPVRVTAFLDFLSAQFSEARAPWLAKK